MKRLSKCPKLLERVIAPDPDNVYIDDETATYFEFDPKQPAKTIIEPMVILRGNVIIKEKCWIKAGTEIIDSAIGSRTIIHKAIIENSEVGSDCEFGPGAHLKRCIVGSNVKMKHQSYLGDCVIGSGSNIGHQASTANFDGSEKHTTHIGENVFIGDSVKLIAPVNIGDSAYIAGGEIRKNIPANAFVIGSRFNEKTERFEEIIKENRSLKKDGKWSLKK
ncbi:MAG: hypothetical protein AAB772_02680 [Patescibacteria group bacterium]